MDKMNDKQKIERIQWILDDAITWYKNCFEENKDKDDDNYIDPDSLTYDESHIFFSQLNRGKCQEILKMLAED